MASLVKTQTNLGKSIPIMDKTRENYLIGQNDLDHTILCLESVTLTSANILALTTTPITLVAAPGAGKYVIIESIVVKNVFGTMAYDGTNALEFRYTDGSGVKVTGDIASAFINLASGTRVDVAIASAIAIAVANAAVVVSVPVTNPTAGDGIITISIRYHIITA